MEFVEQLKSQVDIVQVIGESVRLRRVGAGPRYTGLCPFHNEKTPSFSVHAQHQFYKCFGCGAGGDVIKFVMEIDSLPFWEAVKYLAERHGIPLPKRSEAADEETRRRGLLYEMHELAVDHFRQNLFGPGGEEARGYLQRRGVTREVAEEFGLGLSERGGQALTRLLQRRNYAPADLEASGLVLLRNDGSGFFDRFRYRLMFPIHSEMGKVIGFGGRALAEGDEPKYLNSSETPIYRKSHELYNLNRARKAIQEAGYTVLVEGYMDVIGVSRSGVRNVVATCGTALSETQARAMKRHAGVVVVNFDPDSAGEQAAGRSLDHLIPIIKPLGHKGLDVRILSLSGGLDPDEFVEASGVDAYRNALKSAPRFYVWHALNAKAKRNPKTQEENVEAFKDALPLIHIIEDKHLRVAIAQEYAGVFNIDQGMVLDAFKSAAAERREQPLARLEPSPLDAKEKLLIYALLTDAEIRHALMPLLADIQGLQKFKSAAIFEVLKRMTRSEQEISLGSVEARLESADRDLLMGIMFDEEFSRRGVSMEQASACLRRLSAGEHRLGRDHLRHLIRDAERAGQMEEALRLMNELQELEREG